MKHRIEWFDTGRSPTVKPNPRYPDGIDLDLSNGAFDACDVALPYPAKRIGHYHVQCPACGLNVIVTTAGRRDDPRSVRLACKMVQQ